MYGLGEYVEEVAAGFVQTGRYVAEVIGEMVKSACSAPLYAGMVQQPQLLPDPMKVFVGDAELADTVMASQNHRGVPHECIVQGNRGSLVGPDRKEHVSRQGQFNDRHQYTRRRRMYGRHTGRRH